ncbi:MAG: DUF4118 domain-containing protein, partial [Candidatus Acidiferrales bacterium]
MSTLEERRELRDLTANLLNNDAHTARVHQENPWVDFAARSALPLVATLALVWLATIALVVIDYFVTLNLVSLIYMLPVVVAATQWGIVAGVVAAVAGAAAADFFFYPPLYSFWLNNPQDAVDLTLFLLIAVVTSNLAARLKREAEVTNRRAKEIKELHSFSQGLATCLTSRDLIFAVQDYLSNTLGYRAVLIASSREANNAPADAVTVPEKIRREATKLIGAAVSADTSTSSTTVDPSTGKVWLARVI